MTPAELDAIRQQVEARRKLVADPHPGLITWSDAVRGVEDRIADGALALLDEVDRLANEYTALTGEHGVAQAEAARYWIEVEASQLQVRDLADLLDAARAERDGALLEAAEWRDQYERMDSEVHTLRSRLGEVIQERDAARLAQRMHDSLCPTYEHAATVIERDRLNADLAEANEQRDLLRRRIETVTRERDTARTEVVEYGNMAAAEADVQSQRIARLRRSRAKWRRRANRLNDARPVLDLVVELARRSEVPPHAPRTPLFEALLAAVRDYVAKYPVYLGVGPDAVVTKWTPTGQAFVLEAAVAWYRNVLPGLINTHYASKEEQELYAAVAEWLQPPAASAGTPAGPDVNPESTERISAALSDNSATFHEWLHARSCPTCHSIGDPRDGCRDPWHPSNTHCSQCGKRWTESACGPIADRNDADTYLAGLLNPEAPIPIPIDRVDPDGAADDDWIGGEPGDEWIHRDDNVLTTLTAAPYPYGGGHPDHGVQITVERDHPTEYQPDRPIQCLRLPHPKAVELANWILAQYDDDNAATTDAPA